MSRSDRWNMHRVELLIRQRGRCASCGVDSAFNRLTVDHVVPRSKGGSDEIANLQLLCEPCNQEKGARILSPVRA